MRTAVVDRSSTTGGLRIIVLNICLLMLFLILNCVSKYHNQEVSCKNRSEVHSRPRILIFNHNVS